MRGIIKMTVATLLLLLLLTSLTGVCPLRPREIYAKAGEMVALLCSHSREYNCGDAKLLWTNHTNPEMNLTSSMSPAAQRELGLVVHGRSLVIFNVSVDHQGKYSCSLGSDCRRSWFRLIVSMPQTREYEEKNTYSQECYSQQSCTLHCPDANTPAVNIRNITDNGTTWHKEGEASQKDGHFARVDETDRGVYTCTRSYLYNGQIYKMSFNQVLDVLPKKKSEKVVILSPSDKAEFRVDLGSTVVIDCKAVLCSDFDEVFWLSGDSFVDTDDTWPTYYNYTQESNSEQISVTASLVIKNVSQEHLSKPYTCKVDSTSEPPAFVTINLKQNASPLSFSPALGIVIAVVVIAVAVVVFAKLKMDIALFLRDNLMALWLLNEAGNCVTWKASLSPARPAAGAKNKAFTSDRYTGQCLGRIQL